MITGSVSSEEEDDEYYFGYSEPLSKTEQPSYFSIKTEEMREELLSALDNSNKLKLFSQAVDAGDLESLEKLISLGVSVDSRDPGEWTPLMKACVGGKYEVVQFLLDHGSDPNLHRELFTPLMACCTHNLVEENLKLQCVILLLNHDAKVNAKDKYKTTALMYAIGSNYLEITNELLAVPDIDIDEPDKEGWTPLFYAVNQGQENLVEKLISAGNKVNIKDRRNRTPIDLALDRGFTKIAEIMGYKEVEPPPVFSVKETCVQSFLNELPLPNGEKGFSSDARNILAIFNQINVKVPSLPEFLNMTDKDLYDIGVTIKYHRHMILNKGIHQYHLRPWKKSSMHSVTPGMPMNMEDAVAIIGDIVKHLTIGNASLTYLGTRISSKTKVRSPNLSFEKQLVNVLTEARGVAQHLGAMLQRILKQANKMEPASLDDFIGPYQEKKQKKFLKGCFWYSMGAITSGYLLMYYFNLKNFIKL